MDPLLFGIDGEVAVEVLGAIVLMALLIERALSVVFEWRPLVDRLNNRGLKEPITIIVAALVCWHYDFDALAVLFHGEKTTWQGLVLTALIVAGGSKGSVKLFRDWLEWKSTAYRELEAKDPIRKEATRSGRAERAREGIQ